VSKEENRFKKKSRVFIATVRLSRPLPTHSDLSSPLLRLTVPIITIVTTPKSRFPRTLKSLNKNKKQLFLEQIAGLFTACLKNLHDQTFIIIVVIVAEALTTKR
jgi:hypothetical protein